MTKCSAQLIYNFTITTSALLQWLHEHIYYCCTRLRFRIFCSGIFEAHQFLTWFDNDIFYCVETTWDISQWQEEEEMCSCLILYVKQLCHVQGVFINWNHKLINSNSQQYLWAGRVMITAINYFWLITECVYHML